MRRPVQSAMLVAVVTLALAGVGSVVQAAEFTIDPVHSQVIFQVNHLGVSNVYGRFNDVSGGFVFDLADPGKCSFDVTLKAESVDTHSEKRDQHLTGPDFFNAKEFPVIRMKSKSVKKTGDKTYQAVADLEMHGVTKEVTLDVEYVGSADDQRGTHRAGFEAKFVVNRIDFGVAFMPGPLGKEVSLLVNIEGVRK